ncbi:MAG TPA: hypothetical protein PKM43_18435 [Verrucomicrobiota bacterium]|nr:hypothetical protein [Verrucomicrobiota bacterium]
MKSKLLLLGLVFSLGSVTGLGQFSLSAGLTKDDGGFYILSLSASGSQDLISSLGATLTMEIWKTSIEEPDPTPVLSESYFAAEGLSWPALAGTGFDGGFSLGASFYGVFHEVNASMPDLYSAAAVEITPLIRNEGVDPVFQRSAAVAECKDRHPVRPSKGHMAPGHAKHRIQPSSRCNRSPCCF